jgi:sugar phosphate isomerase/epimerase
MYIALNGTLTGGRVAWPEFARLASRLGYGGVDVDLGKAFAEGPAATRALLEQLHLRPAVLGLPVEFRKDDAAFEKDLAKLAPAAQFAAAIECPRMTTWIMPSSETPKSELRATYLKRFRACAEVLAKARVRLGFEFISPLHLRQMYPHEFLWSMPDMLAFARDCGPNCGVLLDSWHWYHAGGTTGDIVKAGKDRIVHVQVNDSAKLPPDQVRDNQRLLPGEGVIDLTGFFHALRQIGYQEGVSVEVFGRGLKEMPPEEGARLGLETTRKVMRQAGVI